MMSTFEQEDTIRGEGSHTIKNAHRFIEQVLMSLQAFGCLAFMSVFTAFISYAIMTILIKPKYEKAELLG